MTSLKIVSSGWFCSNWLSKSGFQLQILFLASFIRISDTKRLKKQNIYSLKGKEFFQILSQKTTKPISIPVHPIVQEILNKRGGELPDGMPDQHINYALKEIGRIAKKGEEVEKRKTKGGKPRVEKFKKYELI